MNNYEKHKDKLQELIDRDINIAVDKRTGAPCDCKHLICRNCVIYSKEKSCKNAMLEWLLSEYKEPPVDWSKVPVDTPIYVRMDEYCNWVPRYFAKYEEGKIYAWINGVTSFSTESKNDLTAWAYAKLAKEEPQLCSNGKPCTHPNCNRCGTTHFVSECDYGKEQLNEQ